MRKFLSIFLCFTLIFQSVIPAFATENTEDIQIDFSRNFAGDTIIYQDDNGIILEIKANEATTYDAATATLLLSSSGGALGVGTATILANALPVLGYMLVAGVVIYNVVGLADAVMDMYYNLSSDAQNQCADIVASGEDSFVLSASLAAQMSGALNNVFYDVNGNFISSGSLVDPTGFLQYDYSSQRVYGNTLTSSIYTYPLSTSAVSFENTNLSLKLVDSPFTSYAEDVNTAFLLSNSATGASVTFMPTYNSSFLEHACSTYTVSAPVVNTYSQSDGSSYQEFGFWVLAECSLVANGETCAHHYYRYESASFFEAHSLMTDGYYLFANTGIVGLDGIAIRGQMYDSYKNWKLNYINAVNGVSSVTLPYSALGSICADLKIKRDLVDTAIDPDTDTQIYLPPTDVLTDANKLTQTGALTGDWSEDLPDDSTSGDTDSGFWANLFAWLQSLLDALQDIVDFLVGLIDTLISALTDFVLSIFIPSDGFFDTFIADISALFENRFGILTYPMSLLYDFFSHLLDIGEEEPIFKWNDWKYQGTVFLSAGEFNLNDLLKNETFAQIHDIYLLLVDVVIVYGLVNLLRKKYNTILSR